MNLLETLVLGSYVWTFVVGLTLWKLIERRFTTLAENHFRHIEEELKRLKPRVRGGRSRGR